MPARVLGCAEVREGECMSGVMTGSNDNPGSDSNVRTPI